MGRLEIPARERLILALDVPTVAEAEAIVADLGEAVTFYKVGLQLLFAGGVELARRLAGSGKRVFVDAKFLDIPETVKNATANVARLGVDFLTVHGDAQAVRAAVAGRGDSGLKIFAVTVLTSQSQTDLNALGLKMTVADLVLKRAQDAALAGCDGVIASGLEVGPIRERIGPRVMIVTPGVRSAGIAHDDQQRVVTPGDAIRSGADYVVVGRQILRADDRRRAAEAVVAELLSIVIIG